MLEPRTRSAAWCLFVLIGLVGSAGAQNCDIVGTPATAQILSSPLSIYSCNGQFDVWRNGVDQIYFSDAGPVLYLDGAVAGFAGTAGPGAAQTWVFNGSTQVSPTSYEDRLSYTIPGRGSIDVVQTISYSPGNDYFSIQIAATNNTTRSIADFRIIYGADAFVNGDDLSDYGQEDWAMTRTIGVQDDTPSVLFTGFSGINHITDPSVRFMVYYTEYWATNWTQVLTGSLPSTLSMVPQDQGISIGFHKNGDLAVGETWQLQTETVFDLPSITLGVDCNITSPMAGATLAGDVSLVFDGSSFTATPLTSTFAFSIDGGLTFSNMTAAAGSPLTNPDPTRPTPFSSATFIWDTVADGVGLGGQQNIVMRSSVTDGVSNSACTVDVRVDNTSQCAISAPVPGAMAAGDVTIVFDGSHPGGLPLTSTFDFSLDGGVSFAAATAAGGSPTANPDPGRATPFAGIVFIWDAVADGVGVTGPQVVDFRISTTAGAGGGQCVVTMLMIDNVPRCLVSAPAPGASVSGDVTVTFSGSDPSSDPLTSTFEVSVDGGVVWSAASAAAGSPTSNPDPMRATPFAGQDFIWDTVADGLAGIAGAMFRITVDDGVGSSTCGLTLDIDNEPACSITSPAGGSTVSASTSIVFNSASASGSQLTAGCDISIDGGVTFFPATDSGTGSLIGNPTAPFTAGTSDWTWASAADIPGAATGVIIQMTVCDAVLLVCNSCTVVVDVNNEPSCTITSPVAGPTFSGSIPVTFNGFSPGMLPLTSSFDFSLDGGITWAGATAAAGSPLMNPDVARPAPFGGVSFVWNSAVDGAGTVMPETATIRVTVDNGGAQTICQVAIDVDNGALCNTCGDCNLNGFGPDIIDSLTAAQIAVALIVPTVVQNACCDVDRDGDVDVIDSLIMAQAAAGIPVVLMCI